MRARARGIRQDVSSSCFSHPGYFSLCSLGRDAIGLFIAPVFDQTPRIYSIYRVLISARTRASPNRRAATRAIWKDGKVPLVARIRKILGANPLSAVKAGFPHKRSRVFHDNVERSDRRWKLVPSDGSCAPVWGCASLVLRVGNSKPTSLPCSLQDLPKFPVLSTADKGG